MGSTQICTTQKTSMCQSMEEVPETTGVKVGEKSVC